MNDTDRLAVLAAKDQHALERLVSQYQRWILKCACSASGRYISRSDDEWSVSLWAFSDAVKSYRAEQGDFLPFAQLVIRRRLIDHLRAQSKSNAEVPVAPSMFDGEPAREEEDPALKAEIVNKTSRSHPMTLKEEIDAAGLTFIRYGFGFADLAACSPKAEKTRRACGKAVRFMLQSPVLLAQMECSCNLPIKTIEKNAGVPRKILERHRKYLIAAIEILKGDYPCLSQYLKFIREEEGK